MSKQDNYTNVLLEEIRDQNKVVVEAVGQIQDKIKTLATQESLDRLEAKVNTIQIVVTETSRELRGVGQRVTVLEQAA